MIKRYPAIPLKIKHIMNGTYKANEGFTSFLITEFGFPVSRTRIMGTIINIYETEDKKYGFIVIDDGTGTIRAKSFQDISIFKDLKINDIVDIIARVRNYNEETYLSPETITKIDNPNMLSYRNLEIVKFLKHSKKIIDEIKENINQINPEDFYDKYELTEEETKAIIDFIENKNENPEKEQELDMNIIKKQILKKLEELDKGDGVDYNKILESLDIPDTAIENALNELLSEGSCYEPRAGKIKAL